MSALIDTSVFIALEAGVRSLVAYDLDLSTQDADFDRVPGLRVVRGNAQATRPSEPSSALNANRAAAQASMPPATLCAS